MGTVRILILAVSAVAAMGLAFVVRGMTGRPTPAAVAAVPAAEKPMARVLVASRDIKVGERLAESDMDWQAWPVEAVNVAFITDGSVAVPVKAAEPAEGEDADGEESKDKESKDKADAKKGDDAKAAAKDAKGKIVEAATGAAAAAQTAVFGEGGPVAALAGSLVREPILEGEPITDRKLVRAGDSGFMAVVLPPGMRAMAVPVSVETAAGGFILPGDRVDVILSRQMTQSSGASGQFVSETVLRNVRVLAIDQTTSSEKGSQTVVGAVATIELGPEDAEAIALAQAQGDLSLVLRSYADVGGPSGRTARPQLTAQGVRVWRNGQSTEVASQ